jgi:hypothetical protein
LKKKTSEREYGRVGVLTDHADRLSGRLLTVTTPVYIPDKHQNPSFLGSAIFLEIGPAHFVLSAAHVFDHRHTANLYVHGANGLVLLQGDFTRLFRPGVTPNDDYIDISIARLPRETADEVSPDAFLMWKELDHSVPQVTRDIFFTLGFPITKQQNSLQGSEIRAAAFRMAGLECFGTAYQSLSLDPRASLLVGFNKKQMWDARGKVTAPDLNGMSGGGVWRVGPRLLSVDRAPVLSAIVVECRQKATPKHILSTRIQPILGAIASRYRDVAGTMKLLP